MVHSTSVKNGKTRYRYYVCTAAQKRGWYTCPTKSVPAAEIERFVLEQIRGIGRDPDVVAQTLDKVRRLAAERFNEREAEAKGLQSDLKHYTSEIRGLVLEPANGSERVAARLAELQERARVTEERLTAIREQADSFRRQLADDEGAKAALAAFDPVWEKLGPQEQGRLMQLLIDRIDYDGRTGGISITFQPARIEALASELATKKDGIE
jgi:site-specific DNA recombinase